MVLAELCIPRPRAATSVASMIGLLPALNSCNGGTHMSAMCAGSSVLLKQVEKHIMTHCYTNNSTFDTSSSPYTAY
jgi:hypothetical protein